MCPSFRARRAPLLVTALVLGAASCASQREVSIGLAGPLTEAIGRPMRLAAELAVKEVNAEGGINGLPLRLVAMDDKGTAEGAVMVAESLYASPVVAVVGHAFSRSTIAAAPVYNGGRRPVAAVTPSSTAPEVAGLGAWNFRICPSDAAHGAALARLVRSDLHLQRGAVLYMNDAYGRGLRAAFLKAFRASGGDVVGAWPFLVTERDLPPLIERITRDPRIQFLVLGAYRPEGVEVLRALRQRNATLPVLGGDGIDGIEQAGTVAEGVIRTAAYLSGIRSEQNRRFVEAYQRAYPDEPPPNQPAAASYDAVRLIAQAVSEAGPDRERVRVALEQVGSERPAYEGVAGRIAFDRKHEVSSRELFIGIVRDGVVTLAGDR